ncbi:hypothetical protein R6Q59_033392 [Mikania micrantha]
MSSSRTKRGDLVKVVIINTEYIETEANSFKYVVQQLTGRDSSNSAFSLNHRLSCGGGNDGGGVKEGCGGMSSSLLKKGMSFRDLDKLILELPSMDDECINFWVDWIYFIS